MSLQVAFRNFGGNYKRAINAQ